MGMIGYRGEKEAVIYDEHSAPVATAYLLGDGRWHVKRRDDHTRAAWSGPYDSAEHAAETVTARN